MKSKLLSPREKQCLELLAHGRGAKKIAVYLSISYRTVEYHIESIKKKVGVQYKSELVEFFIRVKSDAS